MGDIGDVIASFDSVLNRKGDTLHDEIFQLGDSIRTELKSGLEALLEADKLADDNLLRFKKIVASIEDRSSLDRMLRQLSIKGQLDSIEAEEDKVRKRIGELEQTLQSHTLIPSHRSVLQQSLETSKSCLEQLSVLKTSLVASHEQHTQLAQVINRVNKMPAVFAASSITEVVTRPWAKGLVKKVQFDQIKIHLKEAVEAERRLFHEEGIAAKLQLILDFFVSKLSFLKKLLKQFRTLHHRDFSQPEDIQALRNIVPYACELQKYQFALSELTVATVQWLEELHAKLEP